MALRCANTLHALYINPTNRFLGARVADLPLTDGEARHALRNGAMG